MKALLPLGMTDLEDYQLPETVSQEILKIVNLSSTAGDVFLSQIERAIQYARSEQNLVVKRAEIKERIDKVVKVSTQLAKVMRELPPQCMEFFAESGTSISVLIERVDNIEMDCRRGAECMSDVLSQKGREKNPIPALLCGDVAEALESSGIEVTTSRPKTDKDGGMYGQIVNICFGEIGLNLSDIREHLRAGILPKSGGGGNAP